MRLLPTSVRTRLTLWYTGVLTLPLVAFAVVSWLIFARTLVGRTDAFLADALAVFASELAVEHRVLPTIEEAIRTTVEEVRFRDLDIAVLGPDGQVIAMSRRGARGRPAADSPPAPADALAAILASHGAGLPWTGSLAGPDGNRRIALRRLSVGGADFFIAGLYPLAEVESTLRRIRRLFLVAIPLLILSAALGGSFLAKRSFRPVSAMAARAEEIGATTLHERLPVPARDELGSLARVFNQLLDRLEASFDQQRRFMADASHELRTPTAIIRAEADVTLARQPRAETEYRASLAVVQDTARRLSRIVDDIFLLARADAGHLVLHPAPIYFDDIVRDAVRAVRPLADQRDVRLLLQDAPEIPADGDGDLLTRLLLNLLDNAIRFSPAGATVTIALEKRPDACRLAVTDAGPGIPDDARDRVFERFFRVDSARSRSGSTLTSGAGLGLAIGRRIAEMHGGALELADSRPGHTEFRLTLPLAPTPRPA